MNQEFIISSPDDFLWPLPAEKTAPEYLLRRVSEHVRAGRKECITDATCGRTTTYSDIEPMSKRIASGLYKLGFRKGDTLIYSTHDAARVHVFLLGVWRANGIVRSSYPEDFGELLIERISESKARFLACDSQYADEYLKAASAIPWPVRVIVFGEVFDGCIPVATLFSDAGDECPTLQVGPEDVALVLPTSGTTGKSKGAVYNHKILIDNILAYEYLPFTDRPEKPSIITSRQTHYIGSVCAMAFIAHGRRLIMMPAPNVENILKAVSEYKVYAIMGFPKYLVALINDPISKPYDISSLHYLSTAGQLVVPETAAIIYKLPTLKSFMVAYGMTECGLLTSSADWAALNKNKFESIELRPFSVGKLPPRTSLKVRDIETGEFVGPRQRGELYFKTPLISTGYLNRPEETAETYQDEWIQTGDVGYYDEDGYVYIVDRHKEIFKYFNNHISPSELESILLRHPAVSEAVCCGVPDPDGGDFIPRAFVVLRPELISVTSQEIKQFLDDQVPSYKWLRGGLYILPQIPVGKTGKVTRKLMADLPV